MAIPTQNALEQITAADFTRPEQGAQKFNKIFQFLARRVARMEGVSDGPVRFAQTLSAPSLKSDITGIPADDTVVLNKRVADLLYGPRVIRQSFITRSWVDGSNVGPVPSSAVSGVGVTIGTHADRLLVNLNATDEGDQWYETDRSALYVVIATSGATKEWFLTNAEYTAGYSSRPSDLGTNDDGFVFFATDYLHTWVWNGSAWKIVSGEMEGTIYSPDQKPTLGVSDAGFMFRATDFVRRYRWTGSAWVRGDGEPVTLAIEESPIAISATGWKALDGTSNPVRYSLDDGTTDTITLPDATDLYLAQNTWTGSAVAAVAPGFTGALATESAHTHSVTTSNHTHDVTTNDHTHTIDHDHPSANTGPPNVGGTISFLTGAVPTTSAASTGHDHPFDVPAYTGNSGSDGGETVTSASDGGETVASAAGSAHTHGLGTLAITAAALPPTLKVYRAVKL